MTMGAEKSGAHHITSKKNKDQSKSHLFLNEIISNLQYKTGNPSEFEFDVHSHLEEQEHVSTFVSHVLFSDSCLS